MGADTPSSALNASRSIHTTIPRRIPERVVRSVKTSPRVNLESTSLSNAEYIAALRNALDDAGVAYQFAELGRVDAGGGGTIAYIMANYGMEVIDSGVAVLNMHAPYEVTSKADVYEAVKGYRAFLNM